MPLKWNEDHIHSKVDKIPDILGLKEIGGVGKLVYHLFRFKTKKSKGIAKSVSSDDTFQIRDIKGNEQWIHMVFWKTHLY